MPPRNPRSDRPSRSAGNPTGNPRVRSALDAASKSSRNEAGRYSRYSTSARSYPSDKRGPGQRPASSASDAQQYSRSSANYSHAAKKKKGRGKKIVVAIAAVLVVALIGAGTALALYIGGINDTLRGDLTDEQLQAIDSQLKKSELTEPFYMMLLGSDIREGQSQAESRSDTNILVRVDGSKNQVTMLSILRDTAIELDGHGIVKFNAAYSYGGIAGIIEEASDLCGVEISHYAEVNFNNLVALVDAIGGVDIEIEDRIDDPKAGNVVIEEGMQHLNGEAALVYARTRQYADGDYTRTQHQRNLVQAIVNKVLSLPPTELPGVIQAAAQCVTTDLTVTDIISLAQQFQDNDSADGMTVYSAVIPSTAEYVNGISYVFADIDKLADMMETIDSGGNPDPNAEEESDSSES